MKKTHRPKTGSSNRKTKTLADLRNQLENAKSLLMMVMPHFLPLLEVAGKQISIKDNVETAQTYKTGGIDFGRKFLERLDVKETAFLIAHELGHHYMATFSRTKGIDNDKTTHELVNIASDTQINHMVALYFERNGFKDIRKSPILTHSMWWEADRCWINAPEACIISKEFAESYPNSRTLNDLCRELLPSRKFKEIDELSMEDILAALLLFQQKADYCALKALLTGGKIKGHVKGTQQGAFPCVVSIPEKPLVFDENSSKILVTFQAGKQNPSLKPLGNIAGQIDLTVSMLEEGSTKEITTPLVFAPGGQILCPSETVRLDIVPKDPLPDVDFIDQHTKLIITGEAELSYQPDGEVTIDGYIEIKLPVEDSSNSGHDGWLIPGKNDVCGRDVLKKNHPELTDAEIDAATKAMEQARREASGLVVGDGTSMDIEVREGIYRVPWQAYLQNWLDGHSRMVRTYTRVSRRGEMPDPRCVLPGHARMGYRLNIVLDTSGSMEDLLPSALGAIACFCERNAVDCIKIAECDDELQAIKEISSDDLRKYTVKGCGGTDMTPGLTLFENDPGATAVIVITDGRFEVNDLPRRLPFAVLWCLIGSVRHINAPYGKQVHIDL